MHLHDRLIVMMKGCAWKAAKRAMVTVGFKFEYCAFELHHRQGVRARIRSSCLVSSVQANPEEAQSLGVRALCDFLFLLLHEVTLFPDFPSH